VRVPRRIRLSVLALATLVALVVPAWPSVPAEAGPAQVTGITLTELPAEVQLTVLASSPVRYKLVSAQPDWIVMDVEGAELAIPQDALPPARGIVRRIRVGQYLPSVVRIVVELASPAKVRVTAAPDGTALILGILTGTPRASWPIHAQAGILPDDPPAPVGPQGRPAPGAAPAGPVRAQGLPPAPDPASRPLSLELRDAEIADVLSALAKLAGVNIVTDTEVKGKITVRLTNVTFDQALQLILEPNGLAYTRVGNNLIVGKRDKLMRAFVREYRLSNISAKDFVANILPVTGIKKEQVSVDEATNSLFVNAPADDQVKVQALLARVDVPAERSVTRVLKLNYVDAATFLDLLGAKLPDTVTKTAKVDKASNSVVLTATEAQMQTVDAIRAQVDNPLPQVLIDAMVVEVPTDQIKNLGVAWPSTTTFTVNSTGTDNTTGRLSVSVTAPPITPILNTLIQEDKARLLANPRLAVRDGETARMNIGDKIPFQVINAQGVPSVVIIEAGVKLEITPRVNADGFLTVRMHPEVSAIKTPPAPNVPPTISTREADTSLTVKDGSSIVLAGLIQKNETQTTVKVPILGDIPVLGWLFKSTSTNKTDNEVIFVITPHILQKVGS
jgi:type II secretory pathway component GspD/PulD (secretin)